MMSCPKRWVLPSVPAPLAWRRQACWWHFLQADLPVGGGCSVAGDPVDPDHPFGLGADSGHLCRFAYCAGAVHGDCVQPDAGLSGRDARLSACHAGRHVAGGKSAPFCHRRWLPDLSAAPRWASGRRQADCVWPAISPADWWAPSSLDRFRRVADGLRCSCSWGRC